MSSVLRVSPLPEDAAATTLPPTRSNDTVILSAEEQAHVERLLSERLLQGFCLLERSCPACTTPLVKKSTTPPSSQQNVGTSVVGAKHQLSDDIPALAAVKTDSTTETSTSSPTPSKIEPPPQIVPGVAFCVKCEAHVVSEAAEIELLDSFHSRRERGQILLVTNTNTMTTTGTVSPVPPETLPSHHVEADTAADEATPSLLLARDELEPLLDGATMSTQYTNLTHEAATAAAAAEHDKTHAQPIQKSIDQEQHLDLNDVGYCASYPHEEFEVMLAATRTATTMDDHDDEREVEHGPEYEVNNGEEESPIEELPSTSIVTTDLTDSVSLTQLSPKIPVVYGQTQQQQVPQASPTLQQVWHVWHRHYRQHQQHVQQTPAMTEGGAVLPSQSKGIVVPGTSPTSYSTATVAPTEATLAPQVLPVTTATSPTLLQPELRTTTGNMAAPGPFIPRAAGPVLLSSRQVEEIDVIDCAYEEDISLLGVNTAPEDGTINTTAAAAAAAPGKQTSSSQDGGIQPVPSNETAVDLAIQRSMSLARSSATTSSHSHLASSSTRASSEKQPQGPSDTERAPSPVVVRVTPSLISTPPTMIDFPMPEFKVRRGIAIKVLAAKMVQGYKITEGAQCGDCRMPLMHLASVADAAGVGSRAVEHETDTTECFVCRALRKQHFKTITNNISTPAQLPMPKSVVQPLDTLQIHRTMGETGLVAHHNTTASAAAPVAPVTVCVKGEDVTTLMRKPSKTYSVGSLASKPTAPGVDVVVVQPVSFGQKMHNHALGLPVPAIETQPVQAETAEEAPIETNDTKELMETNILPHENAEQQDERAGTGSGDQPQIPTRTASDPPPAAKSGDKLTVVVFDGRTAIDPPSVRRHQRSFESPRPDTSTISTTAADIASPDNTPTTEAREIQATELDATSEPPLSEPSTKNTSADLLLTGALGQKENPIVVEASEQEAAVSDNPSSAPSSQDQTTEADHSVDPSLKEAKSEAPKDDMETELQRSESTPGNAALSTVQSSTDVAAIESVSTRATSTFNYILATTNSATACLPLYLETEARAHNQVLDHLNEDPAAVSNETDCFRDRSPSTNDENNEEIRETSMVHFKTDHNDDTKDRSASPPGEVFDCNSTAQSNSWSKSSGFEVTLEDALEDKNEQTADVEPQCNAESESTSILPKQSSHEVSDVSASSSDKSSTLSTPDLGNNDHQKEVNASSTSTSGSDNSSQCTPYLEESVHSIQETVTLARSVEKSEELANAEVDETTQPLEERSLEKSERSLSTLEAPEAELNVKTVDEAVIEKNNKKEPEVSLPTSDVVEEEKQESMILGGDGTSAVTSETSGGGQTSTRKSQDLVAETTSTQVNHVDGANFQLPETQGRLEKVAILVPPTASELFQERWATLRAEARSILTRRMLSGWEVLSTQCKGSECNNFPLILKGDEKRCVVCGGSGSGKDAVYQYAFSSQVTMVANESRRSNRTSKDKRNDSRDENLPQKAVAPDEKSTLIDLTLTPYSPRVHTALTTPTRSFSSPMRLRSNRSIPFTADPTTSVSPLLAQKSSVGSSRDLVRLEIGRRLFEGWTLLDKTCPQCFMPVMTDRLKVNEICTVCGIVGRVNMAGGATAVSRFVHTEVKKKPSDVELDSPRNISSSIFRRLALQTRTESPRRSSTRNPSGSMQLAPTEESTVLKSRSNNASPSHQVSFHIDDSTRPRSPPVHHAEDTTPGKSSNAKFVQLVSAIETEVCKPPAVSIRDLLSIAKDAAARRKSRSRSPEKSSRIAKQRQTQESEIPTSMDAKDAVSSSTKQPIAQEASVMAGNIETSNSSKAYVSILVKDHPTGTISPEVHPEPNQVIDADGRSADSSGERSKAPSSVPSRSKEAHIPAATESMAEVWPWIYALKKKLTGGEKRGDPPESSDARQGRATARSSKPEPPECISLRPDSPQEASYSHPSSPQANTTTIDLRPVEIKDDIALSPKDMPNPSRALIETSERQEFVPLANGAGLKGIEDLTGIPISPPESTNVIDTDATDDVISRLIQAAKTETRRVAIAIDTSMKSSGRGFPSPGLSVANLPYQTLTSPASSATASMSSRSRAISSSPCDEPDKVTEARPAIRRQLPSARQEGDENEELGRQPSAPISVISLSSSSAAAGRRRHRSGSREAFNNFSSRASAQRKESHVPRQMDRGPSPGLSVAPIPTVYSSSSGAACGRSPDNLPQKGIDTSSSAAESPLAIIASDKSCSKQNDSTRPPSPGMSAASPIPVMDSPPSNMSGQSHRSAELETLSEDNLPTPESPSKDSHQDSGSPWSTQMDRLRAPSPGQSAAPIPETLMSSSSSVYSSSSSFHNESAPNHNHPPRITPESANRQRTLSRGSSASKKPTLPVYLPGNPTRGRMLTRKTSSVGLPHSKKASAAAYPKSGLSDTYSESRLEHKPPVIDVELFNSSNRNKWREGRDEVIIIGPSASFEKRQTESDTLEALLQRIEKTKSQLAESADENDGVDAESQQKLRGLIDNLARAAEQMQQIDQS